MKAPSSSSLARASTAWLLVFTAWVCVLADVGGGKGFPATPWRIKAPGTVDQLEQAKAEAAKWQTLSVDGVLVGETTHDLVDINRVALKPEEPRDGDVVQRVIEGKSAESGRISVSFSQIESFIVTAKTDKSISLSVTVWPDISTKELLEKPPTYSELRAGYKSTVVLEVMVHAPDGRALKFAGEWGPSLPLESLTVGAKCTFYGQDPRLVSPARFWWAVPRIANDADYPYRMMPLARARYSRDAEASEQSHLLSPNAMHHTGSGQAGLPDVETGPGDDTAHGSTQRTV